jgi:hypothetical protein
MANINQEIFQTRPAPNLARIFFRQHHVPKFPPRSVFRFFARHAGNHKLLDFFV